MKLAISGKGGVGKSTVSAALSLLMAKSGKNVLAVDADPDANLASAIGMPEDMQEAIVPISEQAALIEERTGAKVKRYGQMFKLNPEVSDIAEGYATTFNDIALLVLGSVEQGGGGCACPESVLIRALVMDIILYKDDALIMDMEAGIEHLGRATARGVDTMLIVVEPGKRSIDCAHRIVRMCNDIGLKNIKIIANKVSSTEDEEYIRTSLPDNEILGVIPFTAGIKSADRDGISVLDKIDEESLEVIKNILTKLEEN